MTLLFLPLLSTLLAGCAGGGWANRSQPARLEDREPLRTCTDVELDQDEFVPDDAASCLFDGGDDAGAELLVRTPTTEGDRGDVVLAVRAIAALS